MNTGKDQELTEYESVNHQRSAFKASMLALGEHFPSKEDIELAYQVLNELRWSSWLFEKEGTNIRGFVSHFKLVESHDTILWSGSKLEIVSKRFATKDGLLVSIITPEKESPEHTPKPIFIDHTHSDAEMVEHGHNFIILTEEELQKLTEGWQLAKALVEDLADKLFTEDNTE